MPSRYTTTFCYKTQLLLTATSSLKAKRIRCFSLIVPRPDALPQLSAVKAAVLPNQPAPRRPDNQMLLLGHSCRCICSPVSSCPAVTLLMVLYRLALYRWAWVLVYLRTVVYMWMVMSWSWVCICVCIGAETYLRGNTNSSQLLKNV